MKYSEKYAVTHGHSFPLIVKCTILLLLVLQGQSAKTNPIIPAARQIAFNRARSLDQGVSVSWLEQTWNKGLLKTEGLKPADMQLLKQLGFKSIRLPVAFKYFEDNHVPLNNVLAHIDQALRICHLYGFKLIIDYHYGDINDSNYAEATAGVIKTWVAIAKKYTGAEEDALIFELYNEPPPINPQVWKDAAYNIVTAIRKIDSRRTFIIGASNYNSIYELSRFERLKDENIIYTFHFYEPFLFTHQGAEWIGAQVATTGVTFPYNAEKFPQINPQAIGTAGEANYHKYPIDGNERSVYDKLQIAKQWGDKYAVPIICGEYGCYKKYTDLQSRANYINAVRSSLKKLNIPGVLWDYNTNFSVFIGKPSLEDLSDEMRKAIGYAQR